MKLSTPRGRCGPCCSTAASGRTAIHRAVAAAAPAMSCQVISIQSRFGRLIVALSAASPDQIRGRLFPGSCSIVAARSRRSKQCQLAKIVRSLLAALAAAAAGLAPAAAQTLDKVAFGTNWVAEGEHGGFYQALADGTYRKYGLDVTIVPGGPNANNRMLLVAGKIDFYLSANTLQGFDAVEQNVPTIEVAAMFQKDPQVFIAHPDPGIDKFADLKKLTLFVSKEGMATYYQWLKADYGFTDRQAKPYTFNPQPFLADKNSAMQGYVTSEPFAIEREAKFKPKIFLLADQGFQRLFDADRDAPRVSSTRNPIWCSVSSMPRSSAG